jgi:hypothetical protein
MDTHGMQEHQTIVYRMIIKAGLDPNKFGRITVVEAPGSNVMPHHLQVNVDGVLRFNGADDDTGPSCGLCNPPTPGNPGQVQTPAGSTMDVIITNGDKPPFGAACDILTDFQMSDRY